MKSKIKCLGLITSIVITTSLVTLFLSCSKTDSTSDTNHKIHILNGGTNTTQCIAKQFINVRLTPTDASSSTVTYEFVSNPSESIDVNVNLPKSSLYKVEVFTSAGTNIWWNSIAMAPSGTTSVTLSTNNMGFFDNSYCNGISSNGNNIACN